MKRFLVLSVVLTCLLSVVNAQNNVPATGNAVNTDSVDLKGLWFHGIYNNGTTVKKYSLDANAPASSVKPMLSFSDTTLVLKAIGLKGALLYPTLTQFLGIWVKFDGDATDVYDLDLNLSFTKMDYTAKKHMLEELGFEFDDAVFKGLAVKKDG